MTGDLGPGKGRLAHRFNGHCRIAQKPCNPDLTCSITTKSPNPDPITARKHRLNILEILTLSPTQIIARL
jgi:hypothetical protein